MRRLASHIFLVLMMMALAGQAGASVSADYVTAGGAALRLKKTGTGAFVPEYTHFDSQGSGVAATNAAGSVTWRERYAPFGQELLNPAANANNTAYTGHLKDDATGLNYMQARYYDPVIGRFLSTDPIGYQDQLNLYAYVHNDPVNLVDPNGEEAACFGTGGCSSFEAMAADPPNLGVPLLAATVFLPGPEDAVLGVAAVRVVSTRFVLRATAQQFRAGKTLVLYSGKVPELNKGEFAFRVGDLFWSKGVNDKVITQAIKSGARVRDSHLDESGKLIKAERGSTLERERGQLEKAGYKFDDKSGHWEPPDPCNSAASRLCGR